MTKMLIDMVGASFLCAFLEISGIIGLFWAVLTVFLDAVSRVKQNHLKVLDQQGVLNEKRLALLDEIEGLIALPIRNAFPNGFMLRWESKPTIIFSDIQPASKHPPKDNSLYQTIFGELKFRKMINVKLLFPGAIQEYKAFIILAEQYIMKSNKTTLGDVSKAYDAFRETCEKIMLK